MYDKLIPKGVTGCFGETSEITGAEHIAKSRAINDKIGDKWMKVFQAYQDEVIEAHKVDDLSESQPTKGNIIGNPIVPVIKISGNPKTVRTMAEHIDLDVSGILRRDQTLDTAGDALIDMIVRTANGRLTAAEALGHREFVMTKLYRSA
jgi:altronate dehydratase